MRLTPILTLLACSCGLRHEALGIDSDPVVERPAAAAVDLPPAFEDAPAPATRLSGADGLDDTVRAVTTYFTGLGTGRLHTQLDRPMYRPGDTVWLETWSVLNRGLAADPNYAVTVELLDPQGNVAQTRQIALQQGGAASDFVLEPTAPGGRWTVRATSMRGDIDERAFIVSSYQTPRIRKHLEFVREAYGPGEQVEALIELEGASSGPLVDHPVTAMMQVAGRTVYEEQLRTDETGAVFVQARLPDNLGSAEGLLTVLVEQGGVTESISRSVPIVVADVDVAFFPEGGDLVQGLPGRVYLQATNAHGEPADVAGVVRDDRGTQVARFTTLHDGMGRFGFTPAPGRSYTAELTSVAGQGQTLDLPRALTAGCSLRAFDDVDSVQDPVRVAVRCSSEMDVWVTGLLHDDLLDSAGVSAGPDTDAVVHLTPSDARVNEQGAVLVTVFDTDRMPLAERLVYRNPGRDLSVTLTPDKDTYGPRDPVVVSVRTQGPDGKPVAARVALSVVDDAVIALADDESGHILSRMYLRPELTEAPKDPAFYFDPDEALASRGLDLVMGTRGWRRFEWETVWSPPVPVATSTRGVDVWGAGDDMMLAADDRFVVDELDAPVPMEALVERDEMEIAEQEMMAPPPGVRAQPRARPAREELAGAVMGEARAWNHGGLVARQGPALTPVRVFPAPDYSAGFTGVRTDFRDTVHWAPDVQTDADGQAEVRFYLSDALTQFRLTAEGLGGGFVGHSETTLSSQLPVSIATTLPSHVSAGDVLYLPLTVTNARDSALSARVSVTSDSPLLQLDQDDATLSLAAHGVDSHWVAVRVGDGVGTASVTMTAEGGGLSDEVVRTVDVVAPGFPRSWSAAGESEDEIRLTVSLDEWVTGSLHAGVSWQPSTTATLMTGMEAMIRKPGGCFEQTSSTNWPNVAILSYLEAHDGDPRLRLKSSQALDEGYAKLTGYQVDAGGFETWGTGPGKEALSAFGLLQFKDMARVYDVDDSVLDRNAAYLLGQRTGEGGYSSTGESAHGYGSAPSDVLDGFITWSLVHTGYGDVLQAEVAEQARVARASTDPYVLALAARTLVAVGHVGADKAIERLAALQADDGSFPGARSSITRSYEANLLVESTALAALALMEADAERSGANAAVEWLIENRQGTGSWGATQATALALGAVTTHADWNRRPQTGGRFAVVVNGRDVGTVDYRADQVEPLDISGWEDALHPGDNEVILRQIIGAPMPYTVDVSWRTITPESMPGAELSLTTSLSDTEVRMGETVRLTAVIGNQAGRIVPNPIARIGLPAGLSAQTWQLEQLQDRGVVALFETRAREVTLYWDGLHDSDVHEIVLDLVATVPGVFTGPASSAYPYYNDDELAWQPGLTVQIDR